nr:hypothetical protein Iba_chr05cCG1900 [Ipomoea batatas]
MGSCDDEEDAVVEIGSCCGGGRVDDDGGTSGSLHPNPFQDSKTLTTKSENKGGYPRPCSQKTLSGWESGIPVGVQHGTGSEDSIISVDMELVQRCHHSADIGVEDESCFPRDTDEDGGGMLGWTILVHFAGFQLPHSSRFCNAIY